MKSQHFVIAGAGIGGLSAALFLARSGHRVTVLEQAGVLTEAGAGLQLGANAMKVVNALGLRDQVLRSACEPQAIAVRDAATGRSISRMLLCQAAKSRYGETYCTMHRADLQAVLLESVAQQPEIQLMLGTGYQSMDHSPSLSVLLTNDSTVAADGLVGADGLWSTVRAQALADGKPVATGHAAFRALVPAQQVPAKLRHHEVSVWWGRKVHAVSYPVRGGTLWNLVVLAEMPETNRAGWQLDASAQDVLDTPGLAHHGICQELLALVNAAPSWKRWNLFSRPSAAHWGARTLGNCTLLGDAAHPMLPYLAQGAAMALEDSAALGQCVLQAQTVPEAFRGYEQLRVARTQRVVGTARRNGAIFHLHGPLALARNAVLALKGTEVVGLPWLYGWDPT